MAFNDSYKYMRMVVSFGFFCVAVCELSCFVAAYTQGHRMQSISMLTYAIADSFAVYWFYFQEIHTLRHIFVLGVWWTLNWVIGTVLYDPQAERGPEIIGTSCIVLSIGFMIFRRISLNRAQELVQENEKLYAR
jgi:exosortase/archaeosortase